MHRASLEKPSAKRGGAAWRGGGWSTTARRSLDEVENSNLFRRVFNTNVTSHGQRGAARVYPLKNTPPKKRHLLPAGYAVKVSGQDNAADALVFPYTVQEGHEAAALEVSSTSALNGTVRLNAT